MKTKIIFFILFISISLFSKVDLNEIIKQAEPNSKIELPEGVFRGPITIDKPLILEGYKQKSIIKGDGNGTVLTILASHVEIKDITIQNSGKQRYNLDSGIKVENAKDITIKNCKIKQTLFGIIFHNTNNSKIINNTIISYKEKVVDNRGDGIRLWGSNNNLIANNHLIKSRDLSLSRSNNNTVKNNIIEESRYGIMADMSHDVNITSNKITLNYAGIMVGNGKNINVKDNIIAKTHLSTGVGIMLKNGKNIHVSHNLITANSQAFYIDSSPAEIGMQRYIDHNEVIRNNSAFHFHSVIKNNIIKNNNIVKNLEDVLIDSKGYQKYKNKIEENYWDRYIGFDKDGDGISDMPYQVLIYADKLWQFDHHLKFFYATPLLSIVDFIERLAPFSEPVLLLEDAKPRREKNPNTKKVD